MALPRWKPIPWLQCVFLVAAQSSHSEQSTGMNRGAVGGPPRVPGWPSPRPAFPSSWFGANMKSFEVDDPRELASLRRFTQAFASWPEKVLASNFTNATLIAADDAARLKETLAPGTAVFAYQSQWVAAAFYPEVRTLMTDLHRYGDFFLKNASGGFKTYTGYCDQVHVSPSDYPTCIGYFWNWCNSTAVDYYINSVLHSVMTFPNSTARPFDGLFLDNSDGFNTRGASNAHCDAQNATMHVHTQTGKMLNLLGKWPVFSMTGTGTRATAEIQQLWAAGVGFSKFFEYFAPTLTSIQELYSATEMGLPTIVHAPTGVKRHPPIHAIDAIAAFLVAAGSATHSYFQYSSKDWTHDNQWPWSQTYDLRFGAALGPPNITTYETGVVWTRKFASGAVASINCTYPANQTRFEWCRGNVTAGESRDDFEYLELSPPFNFAVHDIAPKPKPEPSGTILAALLV